MPLNEQRRWSILQRDGFTCAYCGARPGNDQLSAMKLIPHALGGSDHDHNMITACARCQEGKGDRISIPEKLCGAPENNDGWTTWKTWGHWRLYWNTEAAYLDYKNDGYPIELHRVHEPDWIEHCREKDWPSEMFADFCEGLAFARTLIRSDFRRQ